MTQKPESKPKLSLEEKITHVVLKTLMIGGVGAGGGGALWLLIKESDIPRALASAVIGASISYMAKMLQPIHKGNEERAERFGNAINQGINRAGDVVAAKVNSVEERYFEAQATDCELCKTEGVGKIDRITTPMLEDVFVRLSLNLNMGMAGFRNEQRLATLAKSGDFNEEDFTVDIWQLLAKEKSDPTLKQIAILAWGGFGKTTLLRHVAYSLCKNKQSQNVIRFVPILLLLRKYRDLLSQENPEDLPSIIEKHHIPSLTANLQMPTNWARNLLHKGRMLILLDGFDEVPKLQRPLVARWLNEQMRNYPKSVFILSSRPKAYTEQGFVDQLDLKSVFHVQPFMPKQIKEFVGKWYWCQEYYGCGKTDSPAVRKEATDAANQLLGQIDKRDELAKLASNPLLLTMIARFHRRYPSAELPKRRVDLHQEICNLQLKDRPNARQLETMLTDGESQVVLQMLALEMMIAKEERVDRETLLERLKAYLVTQDETIAAKEFLKQVEEISELLVQRDDELEFSHLSFQEFLAAMEIIRTNQESILYSRFHEDWWKQVILFYVGKVKKPSGLIRVALDAGAKDLAYACTLETRKQIDEKITKDLQDLEEQRHLQAVETEVKNSLYQQLEDHLKAKQWHEADQETWKLMLKVVDREDEGWLQVEDIKKFDCIALLEIDHLWVKYSNRLYGFSVQKDIYVECGGKLDFSYPSDETWNKFCDCTAWRSEGKWVDYPQPFFNSNFMNVKGHLPLEAWRKRMVFVGAFIASRLVRCKL